MGCLGTKPSKPDHFTSMSGEKVQQQQVFEFSISNNNILMRRSADGLGAEQKMQLEQHQARLNSNQQIKIAIDPQRRGVNVSQDIVSSDSGTGSATSTNLTFSQPHQSAAAIKNNNGANKTKNSYIAMYDYAARTNEDLSFKKGDILFINEEDKLSNGWWWGRLKLDQTNQKSSGYIPAQYVAPIDSLEAQPWYFGATKRMEAEKLLMLDSNVHGSFLIRISDGNNHAYSLSVRDKDTVKHYRIRLSEDGIYYYITKRLPFTNLSELVTYYSKKPDGLWVQLMQPCIKLDTPITEGLTHSFMKDFEIDRKLFTLERKIGQGQFGDVWQAEFIKNKMKVAIKTLKEGMNPADFKAEASLMRNLCHPKLIQLYALCTTEEPIYIITELMINGSLLDYLQTPIGKRLQVDTQIYIAAQIADGMAYLEMKNYIHRDLAARNVLVGDNNEVKVADFGLARGLAQTQQKEQNIYAAREGTKFPIKWTSPEAAIYNKFSVKSDVWSFGIVLTEIITYGRTPYPSMSNQEVLQQVSRSYRMPKPHQCPDRLYEIMLNCWKTSPEERPTFEALKYKLETYFDDDENKQYRDTNLTNSGAIR
jgi:fyn-related kinase